MIQPLSATGFQGVQLSDERLETIEGFLCHRVPNDIARKAKRGVELAFRGVLTLWCCGRDVLPDLKIKLQQIVLRYVSYDPFRMLGLRSVVQELWRDRCLAQVVIAAKRIIREGRDPRTHFFRVALISCSVEPLELAAFLVPTPGLPRQIRVSGP